MALKSVMASALSAARVCVKVVLHSMDATKTITYTSGKPVLRSWPKRGGWVHFYGRIVAGALP